MKLINNLSILLILPLFIIVKAADCEDSDPCDPGWVLDDQCLCIQRKCPGTKRDYISNGVFGCCPSTRELVIFNEETREGVCCDKDQTYLGDPPNGKCCNPGQTLVNGECYPPPLPPPPPPPPGGKTCGSCPEQPAGVCNQKAICGGSIDNGLQFGQCYQISFTDGRQLGRGPGDLYIQDGWAQNIPFRICKVPTSCGTGKVAPTDTFYIQDEFGPLANPNSPIGWINSAAGGGHMAITIDPNAAGKFRGKMACANCKCVVNLTGETYGVGMACPMDHAGITFWQNKKIGLDMQFTEVPCDTDWAAWEKR